MFWCNLGDCDKQTKEYVTLYFHAKLLTVCKEKTTTLSLHLALSLRCKETVLDKRMERLSCLYELLVPVRMGIMWGGGGRRVGCGRQDGWKAGKPWACGQHFLSTTINGLNSWGSPAASLQIANVHGLPLPFPHWDYLIFEWPGNSLNHLPPQEVESSTIMP